MDGFECVTIPSLWSIWVTVRFTARTDPMNVVVPESVINEIMAWKKNG